MTWVNHRKAAIGGVCIAIVAGGIVAIAIAQAPPAPPPAPPAPVVVGRDAREGGQIIGKEFALRVRLTNVAGPGVQQVRVVRVTPDGNVALPRIAPLKAEGVALATLEAQMTAAYKAVTPTASAFISIADKAPPAPPPPPAPPALPAPPATTQAAATHPATAPAVK